MAWWFNVQRTHHSYIGRIIISVCRWVDMKSAICWKALILNGLLYNYYTHTQNNEQMKTQHNYYCYATAFIMCTEISCCFNHQNTLIKEFWKTYRNTKAVIKKLQFSINLCSSKTMQRRKWSIWKIWKKEHCWSAV